MPIVYTLVVIAIIISILLIRWMNKREKVRLESFGRWMVYYYPRNRHLTTNELYQKYLKQKKC